MKFVLRCLTILAFTLICTQTYAGVSNSASYRLSVTIPAIAGINTPLKNVQLERNQAKLNLQETTEIISRENKKFILKTFVVK